VTENAADQVNHVVKLDNVVIAAAIHGYHTSAFPCTCVRVSPDTSSFSADVWVSRWVFQKLVVCPGFAHWNPPITTSF